MRKNQIKNLNRRIYNKKFYYVFKKGNCHIRDKVTPYPLNRLNECGILGKVINKIGNEMLSTIIYKDKPTKKQGIGLVTGIIAISRAGIL